MMSPEKNPDAIILKLASNLWKEREGKKGERISCEVDVHTRHEK